MAETPAPPIGIQALGDLLKARLDQFPGIASLYLHYLPTGEEIAINGDVAYAGTSTLKIPILEQVYRVLDAPPGVETSKIISETMMYSGNFTANLMLGKIGDGDWDVGVQRMNQAFKTLGMPNTFMAAPYDRQMAVPPRIVTEANSRTDLNTQPDPYMQTTARDIGMSLQMLVACSEGGGTLIAVYGNQITPAECQQALDFMSLNEMTEMLVGGLPAGAKAVHKHGYVPDTHGDVAAIWGPAGPYVLSVFLYRPTWLEWGISNPTLQEIAKTTWDFFDKYGARVAVSASTAEKAACEQHCSPTNPDFPRIASPCLSRMPEQTRLRSPWFALYASGSAGASGAAGSADASGAAGASSAGAAFGSSFSTSLPNSWLITSSPLIMPLRTSSATPVPRTSVATFSAFTRRSWAVSLLPALSSATVTSSPNFCSPSRISACSFLRSSLSQAALIASAICLPSLLSSSVMERPSTFGSSDMVASSCSN